MSVSRMNLSVARFVEFAKRDPKTVIAGVVAAASIISLMVFMGAGAPMPGALGRLLLVGTTLVAGGATAIAYKSYQVGKGHFFPSHGKSAATSVIGCKAPGRTKKAEPDLIAQMEQGMHQNDSPDNLSD